ncbi:SDR family NAD(P)-dependent oxidoreductase [Peribacillus frigoritolerans]|uniref:SDR family NAD(P)-dependent oxidoreductase n=1 Tax=Peribacillus frigoritolerans TaxID=450367 RepID=UPI0039A341AB
MLLKDKTALITGAGSGIGKSIAEEFLEEGCTVLFSDISEKRLEEVVGNLNLKDIAYYYAADVSNSNEVEYLIKYGIEKMNHIDILVNCAGIYDGYAGIEETSEELWNKIININLTGSFNTCKQISKHLIERGEGRVINISSVGGLKGSADGLAYTASKFGLIGLTKRLSIDLGKHGVTVNAVCPGVIKTNIRANSQEILAGDGPDMNNGVGVSEGFLQANIPLLRSGEPHEIASVVTFLASENATYITGQAIAVDGGWTAT